MNASTLFTTLQRSNLMSFRQALYDQVVSRAGEAPCETFDALLLCPGLGSFIELALVAVFRHRWPSLYAALGTATWRAPAWSGYCPARSERPRSSALAWTAASGPTRGPVLYPSADTFHLGWVRDLPCLVVVRLRRDRVLYRAPGPYTGRGPPAQYGARFALMEPDTSGPPDE
jgi:hypothetical protein